MKKKKSGKEVSLSKTKEMVRSNKISFTSTNIYNKQMKNRYLVFGCITCIQFIYVRHIVSLF